MAKFDKNFDKGVRWPLKVLLDQYAAYSVSVSAVQIIFPSNVNIDISMIKQESSWQRVKYFLE